MGIFKKYLFLALLFCLLAMLLPQEAQSWRRPQRRHRTAVRRNQYRVRHKKYNYIRAHDFNNDGKVNHKDRLIWLKNKQGNYGVIHVSEDNEDMVEIMDIDENGSVQAWEMKNFYNKYDLNGNGILEDEELDAAID